MSRYGKTYAFSKIMSYEREEPDEIVEYHVKLEGSYFTGYPAPPCSNHDHPDFSDDGAPSELDITYAKVVGIVPSSGKPLLAIGDEFYPTAREIEKLTNEITED